MRDADVRAVLTPKLTTWHPEPDALVIDELDLLGQVRVDIAVVNGAMWGYEIKSARDTLRRLPRQVEAYSRVMDFASLVVAERHVKAASALVPSWWELLGVHGRAEAPTLTQIRAGGRNEDVDPSALVQLLWRDEAIELLAGRGLDRGVRSKPRRMAWDRLVDCLELTELQDQVRRTLKARRGWR